MHYIIDTHAHYDDPAFDADREELLASLQTKGIGQVINIGASMDSTRATLDLARHYSFVYAALGVHPSETADLTEEDMDWIQQHASDEKVVAIGEIGLDYHYPDDPSPAHQQEWFVRQLELARQVRLPVVIHSREAAKDTADIMRAQKAEQIGGVCHCYSYSRESARDYLEMGFYFGIGGVLTFKNGKKLKEAVSYIPMDRLILETDCPYLAPEPYRGKRNCSLYIPHVVKVMAELKNMEPDEVIRKPTENAQRLFHLPVLE